MRIVTIINPAASRHSPAVVRDALDRHLESPNRSLEIFETTGEDHLVEVAREAVEDRVDLVLAAGGDGTVSAVVDILADSGIPIGIIPTGTTNVLAQELKIPLNLEKACRLLAGKTAVRRIDAMQVGQRFFVTGVGTGLDAFAIAQTGREEKRRFGQLAYVWSIAKVLSGMQTRRFTVVADGQTFHLRAADVLLMNIRKLTGPLHWGSHICPDDGRIDICIIRGRTLLDYLLLALDFLPGGRRRPRRMRYLSARRNVQVDSDESLPVQGDGELIGRTPLDVTIRPGAVRILVPEIRRER